MNDQRSTNAIGLGLVVAGVVVAVLGYLGVSSETEVPFQLPYFASAGVGALMLLGAGAAMLLSGRLARDTARLDDLEDAIRQLCTEVARLGGCGSLQPPSRPGVGQAPRALEEPGVGAPGAAATPQKTSLGKC